MFLRSGRLETWGSSGVMEPEVISGYGGDAKASIARRKYLFVRLLEACDADCFMCGYGLSRDRYRFTPIEFAYLLPRAVDFGISYVRFTGGEPLLHKHLVELVRMGAAAGMKMSIITNGGLLPRRIEELAAAGLAQVIVSIDGPTAETHDHFRNTPGLFERGMTGLRLARELAVLTRVNTVVGPHNYAAMPHLQQLLTDLDVWQWELSAIKLGRPIEYRDPDHVRAVCDPIYAADRRTVLVPMGKRFYGDTPAEQARFFELGVTPRPGPPLCHVIGDVIYLDAKAGLGYGCSLLPHREDRESGGGVLLRNGHGWSFDVPAMRDHIEWFRTAGPNTCTGCSTSAAGYSDTVAAAGEVGDWAY
jgi:cytosylglucuronate decarboxylase